MELSRGFTMMQMMAMVSMALLIWSGGEVKGQLLPEPIVDTQYGQIQGNRKVLDGQLYDEYLGIPYAAPPVDDLRWEKPQPVQPWGDTIWNATQYSFHCTQLIAPIYIFLGMGGRSGEDCLYINVWVPGGVRANDTVPLPVMVYIHGGGFIIGMGEMYPGNGLAVHGEMVVVNFNYRLSALGWLSTEDSSLPGNYGLWDVKAALEWVVENIAAFNGDPNQITIFGQSAGGSITGHVVISPQTNTLFRSASALSGASTGYFGSTSQALRTAVLLADIFNCTYVTTRDIVDCLREQNAHALDFWGLVGTMRYEDRPFNFLPVVDGEFVLRDPKESWELGEGKHINFITGSCVDDAAMLTLRNPLGFPALGGDFSAANDNETLYEFMLSKFGSTLNAEEMVQSIYNVYPELGSADNYTRNLAASKACTEWWFASGSNLEAKEHHRAQGSGKTFQYRFEYHQSFLVGYPDWTNGTHLDDMYSVLGWPFLETFRRVYLREDYDETDIQLREDIMNYYSNFARTGDPNVGPYPVAFPWEEFDPTRENFLRQCPNFETGNFFENNEVERFRYWTEVYPELLQFPPDPDIPTLLSDFTAPTEEELMEGVESLKDLLYDMIPDEVIWSMVEDMIDEFVDARQYGRV